MSGFGIFPDHAPQYGAVDTYKIAADWLDGHGTVYDWGAGPGFSRHFFADSKWVGLDGTFAGEKNVDLAEVKVECDSILMRHVLEHNPLCWQRILDNAICSFSQRMALVTFTAFADETHVFKTERYGDFDLPYLRFAKSEILEIIGDCLVSDIAVHTTHPEHVFLMEKR